jgi:hypothetical protein
VTFYKACEVVCITDTISYNKQKEIVMTDANKTSITVILDKSGSMEPVRLDTVGGYNTFIEGQKQLPGECEVTLIQFNNHREFTYKSTDIKKLDKGLLIEQYRPTNGTALLDAIGVAIEEKGAEFAALPEEMRPGKVMFVIITDGAENASQDFTFTKIKEMIEHQKNAYQWDFTFLGANIDTFDVADSLGIAANKSLSFSTSKAGGAKRAFASVNIYASNMRGTAKGSSAESVSYTEADRTSNA